MAIQGLRDTSNFVANQRPENWRQGLLLLYPNSAEAAKAPLTALTSLMKSESTDDPVFHWWEKELDDRRLKLSAAIDASQTVLSIDDTFKTAKIAKEGDVLQVEDTKEILHVVQDPNSATSLAVVRGAAGSTAAALNPAAAGKNPHLLIIGSAYEEGSDSPSGVNYDPNERFNYTQIFRNALEITRTAQKTRLRTGDAVKEAKRECLEYTGVDMERAFWFGKRHATTKNGKPLRFTAGVYQQILASAPAANVWNNGGTAVSMDILEEKLIEVFRFGSSEKVGFGGNRALLAFQQIVRKNATWNIQNGLKEFGMSVTRITCPFGELVLKVHPLFSQIMGGVTAASAYYGHDSTLAILDQSNIKYRYVDDLKYEPELARTGLDGMKSGYLAECGIELEHPKTHHWWTGITSGVADS
jgi:hypothetical protein